MQWLRSLKHLWSRFQFKWQLHLMTILTQWGVQTTKMCNFMTPPNPISNASQLDISTLGDTWSTEIWLNPWWLASIQPHICVCKPITIGNYTPYIFGLVDYMRNVFLHVDSNQSFNLNQSSWHITICQLLYRYWFHVWILICTSYIFESCSSNFS